MVRKSKPRKSGDSGNTSDFSDDEYAAFTAPRSALQNAFKIKFGQRLHRLILEKGWSQSEFARRAGIPRDSVSTYVLQKTLPSRLSAEKMARALGITVEDLMPEMSSIQRFDLGLSPVFEIKTLADQPGKAHLRINRVVRLTNALKIAEIVENDNAPAD